MVLGLVIVAVAAFALGAWYGFNVGPLPGMT
jgi:hypothetical protein